MTDFLVFVSLQVLSDDEKRPLYDKYGEAGVKGAGMGGMGVCIHINTMKGISIILYKPL